MKICKHCNTPNPDEANFCRACGAKFESVTAQVSKDLKFVDNNPYLPKRQEYILQHSPKHLDFYEIQPFSEGMAAVKAWVTVSDKGDCAWKYGYINKKGEEIIRPIFENAFDFSDGLASVRYDNQYCLIDSTGAIKKRNVSFDTKFFQGIAKNGKDIINIHCDVVFQLDYPDVDFYNEGIAVIERGSWWEIIDCISQNKIKVDKSRYKIDFKFVGGMAVIKDWKSGKYGAIDRTGKVVIPMKYDTVLCYRNFGDGLIPVKGTALFRKEPRWGFVDKKGKLVIPMQYDFPEECSGGWEVSDGLAYVSKNGRKFFIDTSGAEVLHTNHQLVNGLFKEGLTQFRNNGLTGFINKLGEKVIPAKYSAATDFSEGFAVVDVAKQQRVIDRDGREVFILKQRNYL